MNIPKLDFNTINNYQSEMPVSPISQYKHDINISAIN